MNKKKVYEHGFGTASFVIAHAKWQKSRGHQPSMAYKGIKNPRLALALAMKETYAVYMSNGKEWMIAIGGQTIGKINLDYNNQVQVVTLYGCNPDNQRKVKELALSHGIQFVIHRSPMRSQLLALAPERDLEEYTCDNLMSFDKIPKAIKLLDDVALDKYLAELADVVNGKFTDLATMLDELFTEIRKDCGIKLRLSDAKRSFLDNVVLTIMVSEADFPFKIWKCADGANDPHRLHITPPYHPVMSGKKSFCLINGHTDAYIGGDQKVIRSVYSPEKSKKDLFSSWSRHPFFMESRTLAIEICPTLSLSEMGYQTLLGFVRAALNQGDSYVAVSGGFDSPYEHMTKVLKRKGIKSPAGRHGSYDYRGSEDDCVWEYRTLEAEGQLAGALIPSWFMDEGWLAIYEDEKELSNES